MTSLTAISWTKASTADDAASHALFAGYQSDGMKVYVGKAIDSLGNEIPAKIIPELNKSFYDENGQEESSDAIEYLFHTEGYEWWKSKNGEIVPEAVTVSGYYVGRAEVDGTTVVGKIDLKSKQLIASYYGKIVNLSTYDVLVFKPQLGKTQFQQSVRKERSETSYNFRSDGMSSVFSDRLIIRDNSVSQQKFLEMQNRMQSLELELSNYRNDRRNYEQRILFEQRRVQDLNSKINAMKVESSVFQRERSTFEERVSSENSKATELEVRLQDVLNENSFMLKKISNLEETLKSERYQLEVYSEKFKGSQSSPSGQNAKIKNYEDRIKNQQQRIFELESLIENSNADSDSLKSSLTSYESTIEHQKIQVDSILKKLQNANADNEFLVKKLALLTQTLRNYQFEIESMQAQLQNAKSIIAKLHSELARANGQLAKYQAALSSSYVLNGELMTKVSGFSTMTQYQSTSESKLDILTLNMQSIEANAKSFTYNTPSLLEATGSESYMQYIKQTSVSTPDSETGNMSFTPYASVVTADTAPSNIEPA